ncbi:hypothetical protein [Streptomyces sp. NPDC012746]|uniref:hypothetical protein n=1 Tax=Streptomyces sp. NPDC012746 TaxID=3364845 RepID=UPI0036BFC27E
MDSSWDGGPAEDSATATGTIGGAAGVYAPSGAVVVDRDALVETLRDRIDAFLAEVDPEDIDSDDLAHSLVLYLVQANR